MADGETVTFSYDVTVTDSSGGTDTETVTVTINGTNDDPTIVGGSTDTTASVTELAEGDAGEGLLPHHPRLTLSR